MAGTLDALQELQEIEQGIAAIHAEAAVKQRRIDAQQRQLQKFDAEIEERTLALRNQQMEIDRHDLDVKTRDASMTKHREALNAARTNKEYAAVLSALNTEKADNAKIESRQLQLMSELDEKKIQLQSVRAEREKVAQRMAELVRERQQFLDAHSGDLRRLASRRETAAEGIPVTVRETFNRVAERHEGEALAAIEVVNPKRNEYCCSGCNMSVTLQVVLAMRTQDQLQTCGSCGRILYLGASGALRSVKS